MRHLTIMGLVVFIIALVGFQTNPFRSEQDPSTSHVPGRTAIEQNNIGVGFMNQYRFKEASGAFRKGVEADPAFNVARINLGIALFYKQDYDESLGVLLEALKNDDSNPNIHYSLGLIYKNRGESEKAVRRFRRVTELDSKDFASFYQMGVLKMRLRQNEGAESDLRRSLEIEPSNTSAIYNLGMLLLRTGHAEAGSRLIQRFQQLRQRSGEYFSLAIGNQYGQMGRYALGLNYAPSYTPAMIPPRPPETIAPFVYRSVETGLPNVDREVASGIPLARLPATFSSTEWNLEYLRSNLLSDLGGGLSLSDLDGDEDIDAIVTRLDPVLREWQTLVLQNSGLGTFTNITRTAGIRNSGGQISSAVGDYDADGLPDIYLVGLGGNRLYRNLGNGRFSDVTEDAGVTDSGFAISATFVDYDHDGDLDIYVCHYADISHMPEGPKLTFPSSFLGESNRMYRNNRDSTFTDVTEILGVGGGKHQSLSTVPADLDNDRDIDLVILNEDAPPQVLTNDRDKGFTDISGRELQSVQQSYRNLTVADFNRDGAMDLLLSSGKDESNLLLLNDGGGSFQPDSRSRGLLGAGASRSGSGVLDYDNDGDLDLYFFRRGSGDGADLWENIGNGRLIFAGRIPIPTLGRGAAVADLDGDGRIDILYLDRDFNPAFLRNEKEVSNHWIGIRLEGLRSNKLGLGAKLEIRAGPDYQKFEIQGHNGHMSQDSPVIWIGLKDAPKADSVTVRWPSGVLQSEINVDADRIVHVKELDRKGTSCPLLYTWNGNEFEFVTDFLGGCAIGYLHAPGEYSFPDTDEYVSIEGRRLVSREGRYLLNLNNQLEEVIMFDQAQLLIVDHPVGTEVYPNERLMPAPPYPGFKIYTARNPRLPVAAFDQNGNNVLPLIAKKDRVYPTDFRSLPFKGYAETHSLTLDFGDLGGSKKVLILMDAWIDYADSTSNLAASQAGVALVPPLVQMKDHDGKWKTVIPSIGFPAGLPKTMVVDMTGKFQSRDHRIRIVTNMKIFWDRIRVDTSDSADVRVTRLDPDSADLHFRGYPLYYTPDGRLPWIYDYSRIQNSETWGTHSGSYTRFGDVRVLLCKKDDKFVITRHGDEISLGFDAAKVPPLDDGWVRDYMLYADGFGKDMDINSLYPEVMGPLPFHGMSKFPYPETESYPDDREHRSYRREYNTRTFPVGRGYVEQSR